MSSRHAERMRRFTQAGLYLVTSESLSAGRTTVEIVAAALAAGVSLIQLREKTLNSAALFALARTVRDMTARAGALLIINDRLDIAMAVEADGVHLGLDDLPLAAARRLAPDMIVGASSHNVAEAKAAERAGASYVNIGPLFPTRTKDWPDAYLGLEGLREIVPVLNVPFTVMGGIKADHLPALCAEGVHTIALVTAVTAASQPEQAARDLLEQIRNPTRSS